MTAHIVDSAVYGHLWGTREVRALLTDEGRMQSWLEILAALAESQAELDLIPDDAARSIAGHARVDLLDLEEVAEETRNTGHSTLGLIRCMRRVLPPHAREWVYYGATVQDVTDTWTGLLMQRILMIALRDLQNIEFSTLQLATRYRDVVMVGRTHGQAGEPITFGFKAAVWAAEVRREIERIFEARDRLAVGQLAGAVGTCSFWGEQSLRLQQRFCERLGLRTPDITWLTSRDRIAEFLSLLAMITGTIAKIGRETFNLQRTEIAEVRERFTPGVVGSITMPHKRNPELSEQLGSLARVVRGAAALGLEGMVHEHERDGTAWKTEWLIIPEACMAAAAALSFGVDIVRNLEVDEDQMALHVQEQRGYIMSEAIMRVLSARLGKHTAHELIYNASMTGIEQGKSFVEALKGEPAIIEELDVDELESLLDPAGGTGRSRELIERVVQAAAASRDIDAKRL